MKPETIEHMGRERLAFDPVAWSRGRQGTVHLYGFRGLPGRQRLGPRCGHGPLRAGAYGFWNPYAMVLTGSEICSSCAALLIHDHLYGFREWWWWTRSTDLSVEEGYGELRRDYQLVGGPRVWPDPPPQEET